MAEHNRANSEGQMGRVFSEERKKKLRIALNRPEVKAKMSEGRRGKCMGDCNPAKRPEVRKKLSEALTGRVFSEETKRKLSEAMTGRTLPEELRKHISEGRTGMKFTAEHKKHIGEASKRNWRNPEFVQNQKEARNIKPNAAERFLMEILQSILPDEYKYVGDLSLPIGGKNPDFVNDAQKKFIELFGDYYHNKNFFPQAQTPQERIDFFKPYGWDTLIIWERELYDDVEKLKKRILKFHRKGALQKMFIGLKMRGQKILLGGKF